MKAYLKKFDNDFGREFENNNNNNNIFFWFCLLRTNSYELMKAYLKQFDNDFGKEFEKKIIFCFDFVF